MNKPTQSANQPDNKTNQSAIVNALLIGILIGIIIYSVAANTWGFLTLIPLFMIYKLTQKPKSQESDCESLTSDD